MTMRRWRESHLAGGVFRVAVPKPLCQRVAPDVQIASEWIALQRLLHL
jgi:hypothetical protein